MKEEIKQIQQKFEEAQMIFSKLNPLQRDECLQGFSECFSLNHCINKGLEACDELLKNKR